MSSKKKNKDHAMKKKLTTKERKALNHLRLVEGKHQDPTTNAFQQNNTNEDKKKAA